MHRNVVIFDATELKSSGVRAQSCTVRPLPTPYSGDLGRACLGASSVFLCQHALSYVFRCSLIPSFRSRKPIHWQQLLQTPRLLAVDCSRLLSSYPALQVERPLILQPPSVVLHATNLLAVVVWNGVVHGARSWVDAVLLDAFVELVFFLQRATDVSFTVACKIDANERVILC